jgi:putative ABC transport system ATP-binding protein
MEILKLIEKVNRTYGSCVLMVTHNEEIAAMADRIIRLRDGSIRSDTVNRNRIAASDLQL